MATEYTGNAAPAPSFVSNGYTTDQELLFSTSGWTQKGVTLKPGQGVLLIGTFIKQEAASKMYVKTTTPAEVEGVLRQTVDTGTDVNGQRWTSNIVLTGLLKLAIVSSANSGVTLTSVANAKVNSVIGYFQF